MSGKLILHVYIKQQHFEADGPEMEEREKRAMNVMHRAGDKITLLFSLLRYCRLGHFKGLKKKKIVKPNPTMQFQILSRMPEKIPR